MEDSTRDAGVRDSFDGSTSRVGIIGRSGSSLNFGVEPTGFQLVNPIAEETSCGSIFPELIDERQVEKKRKSYAKHRRMSVYHAAAPSNDRVLPFLNEGPFVGRKTTGVSIFEIGQLPQIGEGRAISEDEEGSDDCSPVDEASADPRHSVETAGLLANIFAFLTEGELMRIASVVCKSWADAATVAHSNMMLASVGYSEYDVDLDCEEAAGAVCPGVARSMERSWEDLTGRFPWGQYLAEGGMKTVYKVFNAQIDRYEAVSVMDVEAIEDIKVVGAELAVSAMLSSLARRAICPNFLLTRGMFTCGYKPPTSHWGCPLNKKPQGDSYNENTKCRRPRRPGKVHPRRYQFIRMELCNQGDAEEFIKRQQDESLQPYLAQAFLFQIAFALYAAAVRFSVKHYDIKLLNIFVQKVSEQSTVLRYGLGSHIFALHMPAGEAFIAKLADYGTANVNPATNGHPVTIAQYTTLENTPVDFMILGDKATQGHGHDCFGMGLCMLHLFTGHRPYEELMESVKCPQALKNKLRMVWEDESVEGYDVIRSVILSDVYKDEAGHIIEGEPDETLYDTLYRFLVLFGIPEEKFEQKECPLVWQAITEALEGTVFQGPGGKPGRKKNGPDAAQYNRDRRKFSILSGNNKHIARARAALYKLDGGMELLLKLCSFNPQNRASALDVLNSSFMANLREPHDATYGDDLRVASYTAFSTHL